MDDIRTIERQCRALAQARRLRILSFLKKERHGTVGAIAREVRCTVATASQHLRILRESGVVQDRRQGMSVVYALAPDMPEIARTALRML